MGKLIVIEGLDGCGKSTQLELLESHLKSEGKAAKTVSFPDYNEPSSALVKMYLAGDFGKEPGDVNAYAASLFYAVDRFASYKRFWKDYYDNGGTVVSGRYVTSNAIHQTAKLPESEWENYISWLYELEYRKVGIPKPDLVILLDMPAELSEKLLMARYKGDEDCKDIHEKDIEYQRNCRRAAYFAAKYSGFKVIPCAENGEIRSREDIADDIYKEVLKIIGD